MNQIRYSRFPYRRAHVLVEDSLVEQQRKVSPDRWKTGNGLDQVPRFGPENHFDIQLCNINPLAKFEHVGNLRMQFAKDGNVAKSCRPARVIMGRQVFPIHRQTNVECLKDILNLTLKIIKIEIAFRFVDALRPQCPSRSEDK